MSMVMVMMMMDRSLVGIVHVSLCVCRCASVFGMCK